MLRIFLTLIAAGALLPSATARAFCRMTVEEPRPQDGCPAPGTWLEWRHQCISYSLVERTTDDPDFETVRDATDRSFRRWSSLECDGQALPLELAQTEELGACTVAEYNLYHANANTIFFVDDWEERNLPFDAFGLTLIWHSPEDGEIFDADMQLNETQGRFTVCGEQCQPGEVDLENVITHEAGHFLGLGHSEVEDATMHSRASTGEVIKRSLEADDVEGICEIYGDLAEPSCDARDFQPDQGFAPECVGPNERPPPGDDFLCAATGKPGRGRTPFWLLALPALFWARRRYRRACR